MRLALVIVISMVCSTAAAQNMLAGRMADSTCASGIRNAEILYNTGKYLQCRNLLTAIHDSCELSRYEKERVLELLSKACVEAGDEASADHYIGIMLKKFPHYDLKEDNNPEIYNRLVKKYDIHPLFSLGIRNSGDWIRYKYMTVNSLSEGLNYDVPFVYYSDWAISMYYGFAELEFLRNRSVAADIIFFNAYWRRDFTTEESFTLTYEENNFYVEIPVYYKHYLDIYRNFQWYAAGGMLYQRMLSATGSASVSYTSKDTFPGTGKDFSSSVSDTSMIGMRNRNQFGWLLETGFVFKLRNVKINLFMRYMSNFTSITNDERRLDNQLLTSDYYYVDSKLRMTQYELGASISYTFINSVEKIKKNVGR